MNTSESHLQLLGRTSRLAVQAFASTAIAVACAWVVFDGDSPFRSDDPYIIGTLCGAIAVVMTVGYTTARLCCRSGPAADFFYFLVFACWCATLWRLSGTDWEGSGLYALLSAGSLVAGLLSWVICRFTVPSQVTVLLYGAVSVFLTMWLIVSVRSY